MTETTELKTFIVYTSDYPFTVLGTVQAPDHETAIEYAKKKYYQLHPAVEEQK